MAVKKSKPAEAAAPTSPAKKAAPRKAAAPSPAPAASKSKAAAPAVASDTASKEQTPKPSAAAKAPASAPAAAPKKASAAPIKLTDNQLSFLKQIHGASETGYLSAKKAEGKTIEKLETHKLIKKGSKDKESGNYRYMVSKAGEKFLSSLPSA